MYRPKTVDRGASRIGLFIQLLFKLFYLQNIGMHKLIR